MKWRYLILALLLLCLLAQQAKLRTMEAQLTVLDDSSQRQQLQLTRMDKELEALRQESPPQTAEQPLAELIQRYMGCFDDHDISGLLED